MCSVLWEWIRQNRRRYRIRIINISVGTTEKEPALHEALIEGVEKLWDEGLCVVTAAGNLGPAPGSVTAPGSSRKVITVGSSDSAGQQPGNIRPGAHQGLCVQARPGSARNGHHLLRTRKRRKQICHKKRNFHVYAGDFWCNSPGSGERSFADERGTQDVAEGIHTGIWDTNINLQGWGEFSLDTFLQKVV